MAAGGPSIFISYKRGHEPSSALVTAIEAALQREGFQVWRDVGIETGERWSDELWRWVIGCSGAVAVVSDEAIRSDWCRREWSVLAARRSATGLRVVPVRIGQVDQEAGDLLADLQSLTAEPGHAGAATAAEAIVDRLRGLGPAEPTPDDYLALHAAWLRWLYAEAPALGREPFSLADVYVETECGALTWGALKDDRRIDPFDERQGGRADLVETVLGHFGDPGFREPVVVQGPAGSGKSAFALRLANRLVDEGVGLVPVLVRFRDLRLSRYGDVDDLLKDAVRVAPLGEHPPPPSGPLLGSDVLTCTTRFRDAEISRVVVILDGWDEVTLTGSTRFQQQIEEWLPRLREHFAPSVGPPVRLLLTGRPSAAVNRSHFLRRSTPLLTIRPLRPHQLRAYAARISDHLARTRAAAPALLSDVPDAPDAPGGTQRDGAAATWQLDLARCENAFERYEAWFRSTGRGAGPQPGTPPEVATPDDRGGATGAGDRTAAAAAPGERPPGTGNADPDVLGSPLLALLAFRTVADLSDDAGDPFAQPTALYHALVEVTTRHSGKAEPAPEGTVHRGGRTLRRLLQRVAAVITAQGAESVSFAELHRRLGTDAALTEWAEAATSESTLPPS